MKSKSLQNAFIGLNNLHLQSGNIPDSSNCFNRANRCLNSLFLKQKFGVLLLIAFLAFGNSRSEAQINFTDNISLTGNARLFYQNYQFNADDLVTAVARRPKNYTRLVMNANLSAHGVNIPVSLSISANTVSPVFPNPNALFPPRKPNLGQFIRFPGNILRISPSYKNLKMEIGSHTPVYSALSVGDLQLFGAGATYTLKDYTFRANFGASQSPIETRSFKKYMITGRVKKKFANNQYAAINIVSVNDRLNSIDTIPGAFFDLPEKGLIISVDGVYNLTKEIAIKGEVAQGAFSVDKTIDTVKNEGSLASLFLPGNSAVIAGMAAIVELKYHKPMYGVKLISKRIGQDYIMMGYPFQVTDIFDILISPYGYFLDRKLSLNGSLGRRSNNIAGSKSGTRTSQLLLNANGLYLPRKDLDINFNFANYGVRTNTVNDTFNIHIIARTLSVNPVFRVKKWGLKHTISASAMLDKFDDATSLTDTINDNSITNLYIKYSAAIKKHTAGVRVAQYQFKQTGRDYNINSITLSAGTTILNNNMTARASVTSATSANDGVTFGKRRYFNVNVNYKVSKKLNAQLVLSNNRFMYGDGGQAPQMSELMNRVIINYRL
jgi:hypothetical protein